MIYNSSLLLWKTYVYVMTETENNFRHFLHKCNIESKKLNTIIKIDKSKCMNFQHCKLEINYQIIEHGIQILWSLRVNGQLRKTSSKIMPQGHHLQNDINKYRKENQ